MRAIFLAIAAAAFASPAVAHHNEGHGSDDHRATTEHGTHSTISHERALETAREQGVATVREIDIDDGRWKVEGRTSEGRRIEVEIDSHSGAVLKRELH
jgi:uncharacterized membrane protein YkoI